MLDQIGCHVQGLDISRCAGLQVEHDAWAQIWLHMGIQTWSQAQIGSRLWSTTGSRAGGGSGRLANKAIVNRPDEPIIFGGAMAALGLQRQCSLQWQ